jgi:small subunit ribosomal protein S6
MDAATHIYETTFIVNASLDDAQIDGVVNRVQETITKNGGAVTMLNKWGRKRLAYPIRKKTNGFYVTVEFDAPGGVPAALERMFHLDELILRHLVIRLSKNALKARAKAQAVAIAAAAAAQAEAVEAAKPVAAREPLFKESDDKN